MKELEKQKDFISTRKWTGKASHLLASRASSHRSACASLAACSDRAEHQLPNELARARNLLRSVECSDPKLLAAIAQVESNKTLKSDFEEMASLILPSDPVANNDATTPNKNDRGLIPGAKVGISSVGGRDGRTGVDLRFHEREECRILSKQAKATLCRWR